MASSDMSIKGLQEAQQANLKIIQAVKPNSSLGRAVKSAAVYLHRQAVIVTHVVSGTLRASHRIVQEGPAKYRIYIDPAAVNPASFQKPSIYGIYEHARGGSHAFYETVTNYSGITSLSQGVATELRGALP
jgi:hypothetical protein